MVKYFVSFLFIFLILSSLGLAKDDGKRLKLEYGQDLTKAPFFLRFAFYKEFNLDWKKSDYGQREAFLNDYEINLARDQAKERAEAKAEAQDERERKLEKLAEENKEKNRLRAEENKQRAEDLAERERAKAFNEFIKNQQSELQALQQQTVKGK